MDFHRHLGSSEGRLHPNVRRASEPRGRCLPGAASGLRSHCVHARARTHLVRGVDVRGGKPDAATAALPGHYAAVEVEVATEQPLCRPHSALEDVLADLRRGDHHAVHGDRGHHFDRGAALGRRLSKQLDCSLALGAVGEVNADHQVLCGQIVEHRRFELGGARLRIIEREGLDYRRVQPVLFEQLELAGKQSNQLGSELGLKDFSRVRLEGEAGGASELLCSAEERLMPEVDAVEVPQGQRASAHLSKYLGDALEHFHSKRVYPNLDLMGRIGLLPDPVGQELVGRTSPADWDEVFGFDGPLELGLGSGMGGFALEYAARFPNVRYVAFERRKKFAREAQRRAAARGLKNVRFIEGDARVEVGRLFTPGSISVIRLQFPDPWWKRAHQKRALVQPDFSRLLYELLMPGGLIDLRTDVEDRAHRMISALEGAGLLNPLGPGAFHPRDPDEIPSTRERRYLSTGAPVYRAKLRKAGLSRAGPRGVSLAPSRVHPEPLD